MNRGQSTPRDQLIIFGRYPVPGRTKTRLIPALGPAGAADLQRRLTENILETVRRFAKPREIGVEICFEGGSKKKVRRWLGSDVILSRQVQGNLGERMQAAFLDAFQRGADRVVLLGTDIPQIRTDHLEQAFDALAENDLVIGPSTDGGYWLIGMNHPVDLFKGIKWSTDAVFGQTLALAKEQKLRAKTLSPLKDIDTAEDLKQVLPGWSGENVFISKVDKNGKPFDSSQVTLSSKIIGVEEVEVSAGKFKAFVVEVVFASKAKPGYKYGTDSHTEYTCWFAPKAGIVKTLSRTEMEILNKKTVTVIEETLKKYHIE